jgi:hypothetical protein
MKKLLLNSFFAFIVALMVCFLSCCNCGNQVKSNSDTNYNSIKQDTVVKNVSSKGEPVSSKETTTKGSNADSINQQVIIIHSAPNQTQIDSIKREKGKGKR